MNWLSFSSFRGNWAIMNEKQIRILEGDDEASVCECNICGCRFEMGED
mgnify:CR=1 FL=1